MEQLSNNAHTRVREREFTIWEEAGGNVSEEYSLWHKLRPMLSYRDFPALTPTGRDEARPAKARHGGKAT
jgi:hypothetical protein